MGRKGWGWEKRMVWVLPTPGQKEDGGVGTAVAGGVWRLVALWRPGRAPVMRGWMGIAGRAEAPARWTH